MAPVFLILTQGKIVIIRPSRPASQAGTGVEQNISAGVTRRLTAGAGSAAAERWGSLRSSRPAPGLHTQDMSGEEDRRSDLSEQRDSDGAAGGGDG